MITEIVDVITTFAAAFWEVIVEGVVQLSTAFYSTEGGLTFVGTILFIGLGLFLVLLVMNFVRNLVRA